MPDKQRSDVTVSSILALDNTRRPRFYLRLRPFLVWWSVDRVFAVLGILIGIISLFVAVWAAKTQEEIVNIVLLACCLTTVVLSVTTVVLIWKVWGERAITEAEMLDIANQFGSLISKQNKYEATVAACVKYLFEHQHFSTSREWERLHAELDDLLDDFIKCICDTAAYVVTKKKGDSRDLASANLKYFDTSKDGKGETVYAVWKRSEHSNPARDEADEEIRRKEFRVDLNLMYYLIASEYQEPHCLIDDLQEFLRKKDSINEIRRLDKQPEFNQPSLDVLRFYNSCIVVPVRGGRDAVLEARHTREATSEASDTQRANAFMQYRDGLSLGILCIDSKRYSYFDEYDVRIMKQLAEHAFSVIRASYAVEALLNSAKQSSARRAERKG
jgi:hypothetical protein